MVKFNISTLPLHPPSITWIVGFVTLISSHHFVGAILDI